MEMDQAATTLGRESNEWVREFEQNNQCMGFTVLQSYRWWRRRRTSSVSQLDVHSVAIAGGKPEKPAPKRTRWYVAISCSRDPEKAIVSPNPIIEPVLWNSEVFEYVTIISATRRGWTQGRVSLTQIGKGRRKLCPNTIELVTTINVTPSENTHSHLRISRDIDSYVECTPFARTRKSYCLSWGCECYWATWTGL